MQTELAKRRKKLGLSQKELAAQLGISTSYASRIEHRQKVPTLPIVLRWSKLLDMTPEEFAGAVGVGGNVEANGLEVSERTTIS